MKLERDGFKIGWTHSLQLLADKDEPMSVEWQEVKRPHMKYAVCPRCGSDENLYGEDSIKNDFCGQCGQRLDWK